MVLRMHAIFQRYNDSGVSKAINLPATATKTEVAAAFLLHTNSDARASPFIERAAVNGKSYLAASHIHAEPRALYAQFFNKIDTTWSWW